MRKRIVLALALAFCCTLTAFAEKKEAKDWKIAVAPGHGPQTPGKRSCPFTKEVTHEFKGQKVTVKPGEQFQEYYANTGISYWQCEILEKMGFQVKRMEFADREGKQPCEIHDLSVRQDMIRNWGADISIENHFNAFGDGRTFNNAKGICTYSHSFADQVRDSKRLAASVQKHLAASYGQQNRGTPVQNFAMCRCQRTGCQASILIEHAFMTNEQEACDYFCNPEVWYNYAIATCKGVCEYTGVPYTGPEMTAAAKSVPVVLSTSNGGLPAGVNAKSGIYTAGKAGVKRRSSPGGDSAGPAINWGHEVKVLGVTEDGKWFYIEGGTYVNADPGAGTFN